MNSYLRSLLDLDQRLTSRIQLVMGNGWWRLATLLAHSGDSWFWAIGVGLAWIATGLLDNPFWHRSTAILEISIVAQALIVFALKRSIKRQRPTGEWGGIYRTIDPHSFPSGHATRAMMLVVLAIGLGPGWFGLLIALWAPLMSLSRVMTGVHYLSDVAGGWLLGMAFGGIGLVMAPLWMAWFPFLF